MLAMKILDPHDYIGPGEINAMVEASGHAEAEASKILLGLATAGWQLTPISLSRNDQRRADRKIKKALANFKITKAPSSDAA
jgi:hypothetical protein